MIIVPYRDGQIVQSSVPTPEMHAWMLEVTRKIESLEQIVSQLQAIILTMSASPGIKTGIGLPNVSASIGEIYTEQSAPALFVKTGPNDTDWTQI